MSHPHGIHCLHVHGWTYSDWCPTCRRSWEEFEGVEGQLSPSQPTPENLEAWQALYRTYVDVGLAYHVLTDIERGELPHPPTFLTDTETTDPHGFAERLRIPSPN